MKHIRCAVRRLALTAALLLTASTAQAADLVLVDAHPVHLGGGRYAFSIPVPVLPVGLTFVNAQYNLAGQANAIAVDYKYNHKGMDFVYESECEAIAPTLFDARDGFIQGWLLDDLRNGRFEGIVYSDVPLAGVYLGFEAAAFVPRHGQDHVGRNGGR